MATSNVVGHAPLFNVDNNGYPVQPVTLNDGAVALLAHPLTVIVGEQRTGKSSLANAVSVHCGIYNNTHDPSPVFPVSNDGHTTKGVNVSTRAVSLPPSPTDPNPCLTVLCDAMGSGHVGQERMVHMLLPVLVASRAVIINFNNVPGADRVQQELGCMLQCYARLAGADAATAGPLFGHLVLCFNKFDGSDTAKAEVRAYLDNDCGARIKCAFRHVSIVFVPLVPRPPTLPRDASLSSEMLLGDGEYRSAVVDVCALLADAHRTMPDPRSATQRAESMRDLLRLLATSANIADAFQQRTLDAVNAEIERAAVSLRSLRRAAGNGFEEISLRARGDDGALSSRLATAVWRNRVEPHLLAGLSPLLQATVDGRRAHLAQQVGRLVSVELQRLVDVDRAASVRRQQEVSAFAVSAREALDIMAAPVAKEINGVMHVFADTLSIGEDSMGAADHYVVNPAVHTSIVARELCVKGAVRVPGRNVSLGAVTLKVAPGAAVVTDGAPSQLLGRNGTDGGHAGSIRVAAVTVESTVAGVPAVLSLSARGADGATGLNGTKGADGQHGARGGDRSGPPYLPGLDWIRGEDGQRGVAGAPGTDAGLSGAGGDAGSVVVDIIEFEEGDGSRVDVVALPGRGGAATHGGKGGRGGEGGEGGNGAQHRWQGGLFGRGNYNEYKADGQYKGARGERGADGADGKSFPAGADGRGAAQNVIRVGRAAKSGVAAVLSAVLTTSMLNTGKLRYEANDVVAASGVLVQLWKTVTMMLLGADDADGAVDDGAVAGTDDSESGASAAADVRAAVCAVWQAQKAECEDLLLRIARHETFDGYPHNMVPALSRAALLDSIETLVGHFRVLDAAQVECARAHAHRQELIANARSTAAEVHAAANRVQSDADALRADAQLALNEALALEPEIARADAELARVTNEALDADFRARLDASNAAEKAAYRARVKGAVHAVAGVVSTVATGTPIAAGAVNVVVEQAVEAKRNIRRIGDLPSTVVRKMSARDVKFINGLNATNAEIKETVSAATGNVGAVLAEVDRVRGIAESFREALAAADGDGALNDSAAQALAVAAHATDEQRELVLQLNPACQAALVRYADLCRLRQNKMAARDALLSTAARLDNELASLRASARLQRAMEAELADYVASRLNVFLTSACAVVSRCIVRYMRLWWRAREYEMLPPPGQAATHLDAWSPSVARHAHMAFWLADIASTTAEDLAASGQAQHVAHGVAVPFRLQRTDADSEQRAGSDTDAYRAVVNVSPDDAEAGGFAGMGRVTLTDVRVELPFVNVPAGGAAVVVTLTHLGNPTCVDNAGAMRQFVHNVRVLQQTVTSSDNVAGLGPVPIRRHMVGAGAAPAAAAHLMLCPFATWIVRVSRGVNGSAAELDVSRDAKLVFNVQYDPTDE